MECPACGAQVSGNPVLCPKCGADLGTGGGQGGGSEGSTTDRSGGEGPGADGPISDDDTPGGTPAGGAPGAPQGTGGQAGGRAGAPPGGNRRGYGGGPGIQEKLSRLPLLPGALGGVAVTLVLLLLGLLIAVGMPDDSSLASQLSTLDIATVSVLDLHFALPDHFIPLLVQRFEEFLPAESVFGILWLLPPVFLYTAGRLVAARSDAREGPLDAALSGAAIVVGYFPSILLLAVLLPDRIQASLLSPIAIAGLVYPLLFGAIGGLADRYYTADERQAGLGYGLALFLTIGVLLLLATFLSLNVPSNLEISLIDRLYFTAFVLTGVQTLSGVGIPLLLATLAALGLGFLRVWRADRELTPLQGFTRPLTSAWTYLLLVAVVVTLIPVLENSYAAQELNLSFPVSSGADAVVAAHLGTIGEFVTLVVVGAIAFPVVLGGTGGAAAAWYRRRQRVRAPRSAGGAPRGGQSPGGQAPGGQPAGGGAQSEQPGNED